MTATAHSVHPAAGLRVVRAPSTEVPRLVADLAADGRARPYLSQGAGSVEWPVWATAARPKVPGARPGRMLAADFLHFRQGREVAVDRELRAIESWFARGAAGRLVLEVIGPPSAEDVRFWQACRLRLGPVDGPPRPMVVVLHDPPSEADVREVPGDRQAEEVLLALLLAGGRAAAAEVERWSADREWDPGGVATLTSVRHGPDGLVYTFAGAAHRRRAERLGRQVPPGPVAELATLVAAGGTRVPLATLSLVDRPEVALAAFDAAIAVAAAGGELSRFGRTLYRTARAGRWAAVSRPAAATAYLAALVADRTRISAAGADLVLRQATQCEVDPGARALLAYHLGQLLVKDPDAGVQPAAFRCFDYARAWAAGANPAASRSQAAAAFNGEALGHYRHGDAAGAEKMMAAALDAVADAEADLTSQQVLLLTNLAKVHRRDPATRPAALTNYRLAWQTALGAGSTAGLAYVAPDLVRALLEVDERGEAQEAVRELLCHHDATPAPTRQAEEAVAASCWRLADANLAAGDLPGAAGWYVAAARRCRRGGAALLDGIMQNLRRFGEPPAAAVAYLESARSVRAAAAADVAALHALLGGARD